MSELVLAQTSLDDLAAEIRREHEACEQHARSAVEHAIRAGELLIEAKAQVRHGEWLPWLGVNFPGHYNLASAYMRLARNSQRVVNSSSLRAALKELAEPRADDDDESDEPVPATPSREERIQAELTALCDSLDDQEAAMAEAIEEFGDEPTPAEVREVVSWYLWPSEERVLREALRDGQTVVVNLRHHERVIAWAQTRNLLVKVDRTSEWGNPFVLEADGDRNTVIAAYRDHYLPHKPSLRAQLPDLAGKALACWCAPEPCHADTLIEALHR